MAGRTSRLRLLGGTELVDEAGVPLDRLLTHTKSFALLAYLAGRPGVFVSRDIIKALLWPDSDDARAANSLRVCLHKVRSELGDGAIGTRGDRAITLNGAVVQSDLAALRAAIAAGVWRDALALYEGPFLRGFFVDGCQEYMSWASRTADEIEEALVEKVLACGEEHFGEGAPEAAAEAAAGVLRIRPYGERALRLRVQALTAAGRRGLALQEGDSFVEQFRRYLEVDPSSETLEVLRRLRSPGEVATAASPRVDTAPPPGSAPATPAPVAPPSAPSPGRASGASEVAVGPVTEPDAPARRGGRRLALVGVALSLAVLAWAFGPGLAGPPAPAPHVPAPALADAVARGVDLFGEGRYGEAVSVFRTVTTADPAYGEAFYRLAQAASWAGWPEIANPSLDRALELLDGMPRRTRLLTQALPDPIAGRSIYLELLAEDPDDREALLEVANIEFHWGATLGVPPSAATARFEGLLALDPGHVEALSHLIHLRSMEGDLPGVRDAVRRLEGAGGPAPLVALGQILADLLDPEAPLPVARAIAASEGLSALVLPSVAAVAVQPDRVDAFLAALADADLSPALRMEAALWSAVAAMARGRPSVARRWLERVGEVNPARRDEFAAYFSVLPFLPVAADARDQAPRPALGRVDDLLIGPTKFDLHERAIYAHRRTFLEYLVELPRPGDDLEFPAFDASPQQTVVDEAMVASFRRYLRARAMFHVTARGGAALEALGPPGLTPDEIYPGLVAYPVAFERILRATLLTDAARWDEAYAWLRTFPDPGGYDRAFLPSVLVLRGKHELRQGDPGGARASFALAVQFLEGAEPPFDGLLREAREGLQTAQR